MIRHVRDVEQQLKQLNIHTKEYEYIVKRIQINRYTNKYLERNE